MKYKPWPKRDPVKNYFQLPIEIFLLGLSPGALAVYSYLISTESTTVTTRDGLKRNGNLLYTIRPIQLALDQFYKQQLTQMDMAAERQRVTTALTLRSDSAHSA